MFVSSLSSDNSADENSRQQPWQPPSTIDVGVLDVCEKTVGTLSAINTPRRLDDGDNYVDTGENDPSVEGRTISDECIWELNPRAAEFEPWEFTLKYESFVSEDGGKKPSEQGDEAFARMKSEAEELFDDVEQEGSERLAGDSHYVYGESQEGKQYVLVGNISGSAYMIRMQSDSESVSKAAFWNEVKEIAQPVSLDLERWTPA
ncbi:hypothetical protein GCM10009799_44520 [Nocardiopsis rhodophaea]|uniref:Uncharacterized protein n=2 Tax=Nocardiopsis rhodophaea TaxID=280238 RepID=A0ABN2TKY7_9ACTN